MNDLIERDLVSLTCTSRRPLASVHPDDHNDQRLSFGASKSPWFHHGNGEVLRLCLESMLVPSEIEVKHILLSAGVEESIPLMSDLLQGMILSALPWGEHGIISRSYVSDFAKLECSSCSAHVAQFSWWSRRMLLNCSARFIHGWLSLGRERSSSTSSFSNERLIPPTSLFVRGSFGAGRCNDSHSDEGRGFGWCCDVTYYCD
ncbi:hypothetical protein YC2023_036557 [Brassica napus]